MDSTLLWLLCGLVILLAVATVVGQMLARRASGASAIATMDNLNKRIRAWWLMVAVLAVAFFFGKAVTLVLFALTSFYCLREFISLTPTRPPSSCPASGSVGSARSPTASTPRS